MRPTHHATWLPSVLQVIAILVCGAGCGDRSDLFATGIADGGLPDRRVVLDAHHDGPGLPDGLACSAVTCPAGCCTASGACVTGTAPGSCGTHGDLCTSCPPGALCASGNCITTGSCGPATCPVGCCDDTGTCQGGQSATACGSLGQTCQNCLVEGFASCNAEDVCQGVPVGCNASTCPTGCCQPNGAGGLMCIDGHENASCGTGGASCQNCVASNEACQNQACSAPAACGPANCGSCCLDNVCLMISPPNICGAGGGLCTVCAPDQICEGNGVCLGGQGCGPGMCGGCCDQGGNCEPGVIPPACGLGGNRCQNCGPGACVGGVCEITACDGGNCGGCGPDTCAEGCCDQNGVCRTGEGPNHCGLGGGACVACPPGDTCNAGSCQGTTGCNAMTCPNGCCAQGLCEAGNTVNDCGTGGGACASCGPGDSCIAAICQGSTCSENTCPNGCCDENDVCQLGDTTSACGSNGQTCAICSPNSQCQFGTCEGSFCSPANCPTGCCDQNGACQPGNQPFDCGIGGQFCNECDPSLQCVNGGCVPSPCNGETCPAGCCDLNNFCQPGTANNDCGFNGQQCAVCPPAGFCQDGTCGGFTCGPATCPTGCCDGNGNCQTGFGGNGGQCPCSAVCQGCCDGMGNCRAGTIDTECGSSGATCVDCVPLMETCDIDTFPVVCDISCPSPYSGCGSGGTTLSPPQPAPGSCHSTDLTDAAMACAAGAETAECQNFFDGEFSSNPNCANCLEQFDIDFIDLTGIYSCAYPFLNPACEGSESCANDCANTVCETCSSDQTACENAAIAGECSSFVNAANACIAGSSQATTLCAQNSYPNFGAWLAGVGKFYCEQ
jgi:hypothetical protein